MIENISNLFSFLGGLGMFLYGMNIMADGMQKTAGGKMQKFLEMLTNNRIMAIISGAIITAIIQSSGATTVMVVGFVSAGVMSLTQAVGVIMGANIGTTITSWIVSMSQFGDSLIVINPEFYAPLFIGIGALILVFSSSHSSQKKKLAGEILTGLGFLFMGLSLMSSSIKPYTTLPIFSEAFRLLGNNPFLGMMVGCLVTALLQSSSASVGILQTLALNGVVTANAAIYITLGQNIGSCVTALISSMGSSRTAKRAAAIHLLFNLIGAVIFGIGGFILFSLNPGFAGSNINSVQISIFHTMFNLTNTALLFPFASQLVKLSGIIVRHDDQKETDISEEEYESTLKHLDDRIFETPAFAVEAAVKEVLHMGEVATDNVKLAMKMIMHNDSDELEKVFATEKIIDKMQNTLTEYLIKVDNLSLNEEQKLLVNHLFYSISDIERVGDHAENLAENIKYMKEKNIKISPTGADDLKKISESAYNSLYYAIDARRTGSLDSVRKVWQFEDDVDNLEDELSEKHLIRLSKGECSPEAGMIFMDILSNLERISDHAVNIAGYVRKEM